MIDKTLELAQALIRRPSITPRDEGCQELLAARLAPLGFEIERLRFGDVDNLWARRGEGQPLVVFAGHTDVVPPGPREAWHSDPFSPTIRDGTLYGRGAADMKTALAACVTAVDDFLARHPSHPGAIGFLITSDEEGAAVDGTVKVVEWLARHGIAIRYCVVVEPTSSKTLGDVIKNGRRGSLNARLVVRGVQGHIAYPQLACNPIHLLVPCLAELIETRWDTGNADFPPTSFQASNIRAGTGATNVIPGSLELDFNFRFSSAVTDQQLRERVEETLARHRLDCSVQWSLSGQPYLTPRAELVAAAREAVRRKLALEPKLSTDGGTSDGRFIAPAGAQVVELGAVNATIHKANECIAVDDLGRMAGVYAEILEILLS